MIKQIASKKTVFASFQHRSASCSIWQVCWHRGHDQHLTWHWPQNVGPGPQHSLHAHRPCPQLQELPSCKVMIQKLVILFSFPTIIHCSLRCAQARYQGRRVRDRPRDDAPVHRAHDLCLHRQWQCVTGGPGDVPAAAARVRLPFVLAKGRQTRSHQ